MRRQWAGRASLAGRPFFERTLMHFSACEISSALMFRRCGPREPGGFRSHLNKVRLTCVAEMPVEHLALLGAIPEGHWTQLVLHPFQVIANVLAAHHATRHAKCTHLPPLLCICTCRSWGKSVCNSVFINASCQEQRPPLCLQPFPQLRPCSFDC